MTIITLTECYIKTLVVCEHLIIYRFYCIYNLYFNCCACISGLTVAVLNYYLLTYLLTYLFI
jgi:hypothetical protein